MVKKKVSKDLIYPVSQAVEMVAVDRTPHDLSQHQHPVLKKSQSWYDFWGKKCPVCKAPANIIMEPKDESQADVE